MDPATPSTPPKEVKAAAHPLLAAFHARQKPSYKTPYSPQPATSSKTIYVGAIETVLKKERIAAEKAARDAEFDIFVKPGPTSTTSPDGGSAASRKGSDNGSPSKTPPPKPSLPPTPVRPVPPPLPQPHPTPLGPDRMIVPANVTVNRLRAREVTGEGLLYPDFNEQ